MVAQFSSVCLNRSRYDNKFWDYNTAFEKGHTKEKCVLNAA